MPRIPAARRLAATFAGALLTGSSALGAELDAAPAARSSDDRAHHEHRIDCRTEPPAGLVQELLAWVGQHSSYDVSATDPPAIAFCEPGARIDYESDSLTVDRRLRAVYDLSRRTIYLVRPWSATKVRDQATLLHELIHDLQYAQRSWGCVNEAEAQAYRLQEAWLRERGEDPGFDWPQIFLLSRCPNDVHP